MRKMKKIIIVDDDLALQEAFRLIFSGENYELTLYTDAAPLLNNVIEKPDLFILDKQLSGVDGLDICRIIKSRPETSEVPVIILSASPNINRLAAAAGADDVLEKPFRIQALRESASRQLLKNVS